MRCRASLLIVVLFVVGCMEGQKAAPVSRSPSLYSHLGGEAKIQQVVDRFAERAATTAELGEPIKTAIQENKSQLVQQLSAALGGPRSGGMKGLQDVFGPLGELSPEDRKRLLGLLDKALAESEVGKRTRDEVMKALAPLERPPANQPEEKS
jgi:truncated hemoglobin YjbI